MSVNGIRKGNSVSVLQQQSSNPAYRFRREVEPQQSKARKNGKKRRSNNKENIPYGEIPRGIVGLDDEEVQSNPVEKVSNDHILKPDEVKQLIDSAVEKEDGRLPERKGKSDKHHTL